MARLLTVGVLLLALALAPTAAARPLVTAVDEFKAYTLPDAEANLVFARIRASGSSVARIYVNWRGIAPATLPLVWDPTNPADPRYNWFSIDRQVRLAAANGLQPLLGVHLAPSWAEGPGGGRAGTNSPNAVQLGLFAKAITERYDGDFDPDGGGPAAVLPEVRLWEVWNEPNLAHYLNPQYDATGRIVAADIYRSLVNAFSASAHAVDPGNIVAAGALAPFGRDTGSTSSGPLPFIRTFFCCEPVRLDRWSHHAYTQGGPTHHAYHPDDVSLGDLPELRAAINRAQASGKIVAAGPVPLWVTEFSWDTRPPDPLGVPQKLHARWVSEALYRMWRSGVTLVTWWTIRDRPMSETYEQGGLFFCGSASTADDGACAGSLAADRQKLAFRAFRFPFVALPRAGGVYVWGRTPTSSPGRVVIQRRVRGGWQRVASLRADADGMFARRLSLPKIGTFRARFRRENSLRYALKRPRDVEVRYIFGCGGTIPCS